MSATTARSIRIPSELWETAIGKARQEGTTVTAVVLAALQTFNATEEHTMSSTIKIGRVRHLTTTEVVAVVNAAYRDGSIISDACAASIAAYWQSPGAGDMPFTLLAQGSAVSSSDLLDAIARESSAYTYVPEMLTQLGNWAMARANGTES